MARRRARVAHVAFHGPMRIPREKYPPVGPSAATCRHTVAPSAVPTKLTPDRDNRDQPFQPDAEHYGEDSRPSLHSPANNTKQLAAYETRVEAVAEAYFQLGGSLRARR